MPPLPVLILVGAMMFRSVAAIDFDRFEDALPGFLTVALIPLTFSITQGILWGFIAHVGLYLLAGRRREVKPAMYVLAVMAIGLLVLEHGRWRSGGIGIEAPRELSRIPAVARPVLFAPRDRAPDRRAPLPRPSAHRTVLHRLALVR